METIDDVDWNANVDSMMKHDNMTKKIRRFNEYNMVLDDL